MKKLITILTITMFLSSCINDKIELKQEQYKQLIGDTIKPEYPKVIHTDRFHEIEIIKIENHEYLQGYERRHISTYFLIHYPDCKYCKKDTL